MCVLQTTRICYWDSIGIAKHVSRIAFVDFDRDATARREVRPKAGFQLPETKKHGSRHREALVLQVTLEESRWHDNLLQRLHGRDPELPKLDWGPRELNAFIVHCGLQERGSVN